MSKSDDQYINRELSWVEFNARVLAEALQESVPLLERLRFLSIVSSNFDEYFMIRVAGLKTRFRNLPDWRDINGVSAFELLERLSLRIHELVKIQYDCLMNCVIPGLALEGVRYVETSAYSVNQSRFLESFFMNDVFPLLTPLRSGLDGSLPSIGNLRLHAAFMLKQGSGVSDSAVLRFLETTGAVSSSNELEEVAGLSMRVAIVQIPASIPRIVWMPDEGGERIFTLLDDVLLEYGHLLFPGFEIKERLLFKITRDANGAVDEDRDDDFIEAIQEVLDSRLSSQPVRLMCTGDSPTLLKYLKKGMALADSDVYSVDGPIDLHSFIDLVMAPGLERLRYESWKNYLPVTVPLDTPIWDELKRTDVFLHAPYHSYDPVLRFINDAVNDSKVLAIKMTLYRTSGDSPVVRSLENAARSGKQVTVFVELKARFDEERNISWVQRLEDVGVIVVYGIARLKVHAKILLVVRCEPDGTHRYVHLSTGNYNDKTAKIYSDMSLFTANKEIANDATLFFNMISGYSAILRTKRLVMAPIDLKTHLLSLIDREIERSMPEKPGLIMAKMNSLADPKIIKALYRASQSGVRVMLNVRGICMLVPGVPGMSETITVVSIIDRYLEHSRITWFQNGGSDELYLASADWMPRNLDRRVELMFPVLQKNIREEIRSILELYFEDNTQSHVLQSDGTWERRVRGKKEKRVRAQESLYRAEKARQELFEQAPRREFTVRRN
ncbi:MAG TPA: polyphosphate kinase 1 [Treponema sp.]|nr:polyphosphate kinase 1 [Treponema sp.]